MKFLTIIAAASLSLSAVASQASQIVFVGGPATSFADGTLTTTAVGPYPGGFYSDQLGSPTAAFNGYGANDLFINFNSAVKLNQLTLEKCSYCADTSPRSFTATLYDAANLVIGQQTIGASFTPTTLLFGTVGVKSLGLTFAGGSDNYGVGYTSAWYRVSNVTYNGAVPEPASWALMIAGFGLVGASFRTRRRALGTA